jgi:NADH:ubiquinone oxidoreductase subunit K
VTVTLNHYLVLGAILFAIGVYGALTRRNAVGILMALELVFNAVTLTLVAAARWQADPRGQLFALFVIAVAAAESVLGLALILAIYRRRGIANADEMTLLKR